MPRKPPKYKARRGTSQPRIDRRSAHERGYTTAWAKESKAYLRENPLCVRCKANGKVKLAQCTDHVKPAKYFRELFWDRSNWQALCTQCNTIKSFEDERKYGHMENR